MRASPISSRKRRARSAATAQVAGGVPAMCDGVTQGEKGMELSLFSRDVIALSTAVALSHDMFDAAVYLGICDKIVPGLIIGALSFGHLPAVFLPAGPMPSGLGNTEKSKVRQLYAEGKASRADLLAAEAEAYHAPGTCTFYGTANTNQMLMEIMGLHLPGSSFVNPNTPLRDALTMLGVKRALEITALGNQFAPIGRVIDERAIVNGVVGLHATGGSTNLTIHLVAMAAAAGIALRWEDFADLAEVTPLLARIYPNGKADVNHFHAAGGMGLLIRELLGAGLVHGDAQTVWGELDAYAVEPRLDAEGAVAWAPAAAESGDRSVLREAGEPFQSNGGLRVLEGPLGRAVIKTSAVAPDRHTIEAPARVFHSQEELHVAFRNGELNRDFVAVLRFQGPKAIGMPELHKLMPPLGRAAGSRASGRARHRRAPVGRLGQGAVGDPCDAGGGGGRSDRQDQERRRHSSRRAGGPARRPGRRGCLGAQTACRGRSLRVPCRRGARIVRGLSRRSQLGRRGRGDFPRRLTHGSVRDVEAFFIIGERNSPSVSRPKEGSDVVAPLACRRIRSRLRRVAGARRDEHDCGHPRPGQDRAIA